MVKPSHATYPPHAGRSSIVVIKIILKTKQDKEITHAY